jgi:signal transduction histidine kinase
LHQIIAEFSDKLENAGLDVIFDGESKASIMADGRHMWRLMDNIFENVCKYSLKGTRVYVSVRELSGKTPKKILISVKNVSATPNTLQGNELTERFIRGDSSRTSEGSGLGLYIAKSLTELQNGSFEVIADGDLFKVDIIFDILKQ